jgi:hypothetical protein
MSKQKTIKSLKVRPYNLVVLTGYFFFGGQTFPPSDLSKLESLAKFQHL